MFLNLKPIWYLCTIIMFFVCLLAMAMRASDTDHDETWHYQWLTGIQNKSVTGSTICVKNIRDMNTLVVRVGTETCTAPEGAETVEFV